MNKRNWTMFCGFACALVVVFGTSLARPAPAPPTVPPAVPLVPFKAVVAAWAHVQSYSGTYSGDIKQSSSAALSEHFQGSVVLTRMPNPNPSFPIISFYGTGDTLATGSGTCGTGSTHGNSFFVLTLNLTSNTYQLSPSPNPGALQISGGPPGCPKPYYNTVHVGQFFVKTFLPTPTAGICGSKTAQLTLLAGGTETDKFSWKLAPTMSNHQKIKMQCISLT